MERTKRAAVIFLSAIWLLLGNCYGQGAEQQKVESVPKPAKATVAAPFRDYKFYGGAQLTVQLFNVVSTTYPIQEAIVLPVSVFAGYQLGNRLALQAGFAQYRRPTQDYTYYNIDQAGQPIENQVFFSQYDAAVPLLLRYDIARRPHRVHLDVLLGCTLVKHRYSSRETARINGTTVFETVVESSANNLFGTLGGSAGFLVSPHVDLLVDALLYRNITSIGFDFPRKVTFGVGAGLRYRFDVKRKPTKEANAL